MNAALLPVLIVNLRNVTFTIKREKAMRRLTAATLTAIACLGIAIPNAVAQTAKDLIGTWTLKSDDSTTPDGRKIQPFGPKPRGIARRGNERRDRRLAH